MTEAVLNARTDTTGQWLTLADAITMELERARDRLEAAAAWQQATAKRLADVEIAVDEGDGTETGDALAQAQADHDRAVAATIEAAHLVKQSVQDRDLVKVVVKN